MAVVAVVAVAELPVQDADEPPMLRPLAVPERPEPDPENAPADMVEGIVSAPPSVSVIMTVL